MISRTHAIVASRSKKLQSPDRLAPFRRISSSPRSAASQGPVIGLFGDIHFQDKGLNRILQTSEWIIDTFKKRRVDAVVCLGDVLNTREQVSVRALSAAMSFFDKMSESLEVPIHILLGNHDMNLKHSSKVSSLDALATKSMLKGGSFHLYRDITPTTVAGIPALMIPYHEDIAVISRSLHDLETHSNLKDTVVFGHLAVNGAIQNGSSAFRYHGSLSSATFRPVKRTFSGHFHVHQTLPDNVTYVGAPLQFNFGDAGANRGVVVYDGSRDSFSFLENPHCHQYFKLREEEVLRLLVEQPSTFKDSFVTINYSGAKLSPVHHEELKEKLLRSGASAVFKQSDVLSALKESGQQLASKLAKQHTVEDQIRLFAQSVRSALLERASAAQTGTKKKSSKTVPGQKWDHFLVEETSFSRLVDAGLKIVRDAKVGTSSIAGADFDGRLARLSMTNFMGVRGTIEISFSTLPRGIWLIDGDNGAGKSTIFEAIVWCQFGEFLRSGMQKDFAINDAEDSCIVSIEYENGFIIERCRRRGKAETLKTMQRTGTAASPQYLEQNELGELRHTQKLVNDKLGIDFDTFSKSVVLGQNIFSNFLSGSREQRRSIIEEMLGLDKFNMLFDCAKVERQRLEKEIDDVNRQKQDLQSRISDANQTLTDLQVEIDTATSLKRAESRSIEEAETKKKVSVDKIRREKEQTSQKYESVCRNLNDLNQAFRGFSVSLAHSTLADLKLKHNHVKSVVSSRNTCPTCGQNIDPHHVDRLKADCISSLLATKKSFSLPIDIASDLDFDRCVEKLTECISNLSEKIESFQDTTERLSSSQKELQLKLVHLENDILRCESQYSADIQLLRERIAAADSILGSQQALASKINAALSSAEEELEKLRLQLATIEESYNYVKFWELAFDKQSKLSSGFSTIRSFIFKEVVVELNAIIDTYAEQLSSKTSLKVTLTPELDIEEVYGKRSGGERKRTDLAVLFSLFEIVRDRSRFRPNFIMLDEVFDALDRGGRLTVGQVLTDLVRRVDNVFVITHTDLATGLSLAGTITARMQMDDSNPSGTLLEIQPL